MNIRYILSQLIFPWSPPDKLNSYGEHKDVSKLRDMRRHYVLKDF